MKKKFYYIFIFFIITIFSCNSLSEPKENFFDSVKVEIKDTVQEIDTLGSVEHENNTYVVKKNSVIFFMPSRQEKKELEKQYGNFAKYDLQQIFSNFEQFARSSRRRLSKKNIESELTTDIIFEIEMDTGGYVVFDKSIEDQIIGVIFSNGVKEPIIKYGVIGNKEVSKIVSEFFEVEYEEEIVDTIVSEDKIEEQIINN